MPINPTRNISVLNHQRLIQNVEKYMTSAAKMVGIDQTKSPPRKRKHHTVMSYRYGARYGVINRKNNCSTANIHCHSKSISSPFKFPH